MSGCVRFPVDDPAWPSSREGGMFVKLYFVETDFKSWWKCCGQDSYDFLSECVQGFWHAGKLHKHPQIPEGGLETEESFDAFQAVSRALEETLFPRCNEQDPPGDYSGSKYLSRPMVASVTLGSTGWSGWNGDDYWVATPDDLTQEGKNLLQALIELYPGCDWFLATFLDT